MLATKATVAKSVIELKIVLESVKPAVWRRLRVPAGVPLARLARILIAAMGWKNAHLHEFRFGQGIFTDPETAAESGELGGEEAFSERGKTLAVLVSGAGESFKFIYDFGDYWVHTVTVEAIRPAAPGEKGPTCMAGKNACPPEDCGGSGGYARMLAILRDPENPEYGEYKEWLERDFDPRKFVLEDHQPQVQGRARK